MDFEIRPVQREEFDDWLRLRDAVYTGIDHSFHQREIELYFADPSKQCLLAFTPDDNACGLIELSLRNVVDGCLSSPVGYVEGVYVDPKFRGKGLSRRLVQHAEQWCREQGCTEMATDAELSNTEAQQFHRHMGFQETYRIVEFRKGLV